MKTLEIILWISIFIIFYTYVGYGIVLYIMVKIKRIFSNNKNKGEANKDYEPEVTLLVAAYNEKDYVDAKIRNSKSLNYPQEKVRQIWVTDGSDDGTPDLLRHYPDVEVLHQTGRRGKIAAINRAISHVKTPIVIFSDANTDLGEDSIRLIVEMFANPKVGCVSGEKRIRQSTSDAAASAGEGLYWKYESTLKKWDAELYSVVGAAGELFAVRTELFKPVEPDTLLDDFIISLRIAMQGYTIQYNPEAYAIETASANVKEELKRKIRIAAGGIQSVVRLAPLLNTFRYGLLSFQYISHRVLRWTITPLMLLVALISNALLIHTHPVYLYLMVAQGLFYVAALLGWYLENRKIKLKILFVPYYFFIMNYAVYMGFGRYIKKQQNVNWERAKRG